MSLDTERQFICPRLIDYLTIVGARYSNNPSRQNTSPHVQVNIDCMKIVLKIYSIFEMVYKQLQ